MGYLGEPRATSEVVTSDGWLRSGDLGYISEVGHNINHIQPSSLDPIMHPQYLLAGHKRFAPPPPNPNPLENVLIFEC